MQRKFSVSVVCVTLLAVLLPLQVFANPRRSLLGDQITISNINFPSVAFGPGRILPDSPLFFIDKTYQGVKLVLAGNSQNRAKVHVSTMNERFAELRVMTARANQSAIDMVLSDIAYEAQAAASDLKDASSHGKNVSLLAKDINDLLRLHREILKIVAEQAPQSLAYRIEGTRESLLSAKVSVEDQLTTEHLAEAIQNDLEDELDTQVLGVTTSTFGLEQSLTQIEKLASEEAKKANREIKELKEKIKTERKEVKEELKTRREELKKAREQAAAEVKVALQKLKEAIMRYKAAREAERNLINNSGHQKIDPTQKTVKSMPVERSKTTNTGSSNASEF